MKRKSLVITALIVIILLAATAIGPRLVLRAVTQPESAESYAYSGSFLNDYGDVRARLSRRVDTLRVEGISAESYSHAIDEEDGL